MAHPDIKIGQPRIIEVKDAGINPLDVTFAIREISSGQRIIQLERTQGGSVLIHSESKPGYTTNPLGKLEREDHQDQPPISRPYATFSSWEE